MRLDYTGSLLHYAVGLDLVVHTRCGCGHQVAFPQNRDQYLIMGLVYSVLEGVQLKRDEPTKHEALMTQAEGTFMSVLKDLYPRNLVEVEEQDHYKECDQS